MKIKSTLLVLLSFVTLAAHADLQDGSCKDNNAKAVSNRTVTINGKTLAYTATVGYLEVTAADGASKACVFYTAYEVKPEPGNSVPRPITFAFNGGPGSASVWLHLGVLGPRRVDMGKDGLHPPQSLALIDNESSPLDVTDVVMIDPVATGFSRPAPGVSNDKFFGVKNDYKSIASFIQNYLSVANRWLSPKFIMGESYGGIRGPLLTQELESNLGIGIDGLILISPALSWTSLDFSVPDNNIPYWTFFPNFATSAWYHKKASAKYLAMDVDTVYTTAKKFAESSLRDTLDLADNMSDAEYDQVAQTMSDFTGISKDALKDMDLRISDSDFFGQLLSSSNQVVGRYDARYTAPMTLHRPGADGWADPSGNATMYTFTAGINDYLRTDLGFPAALSPYNIFANIDEWPFGTDGAALTVINDLGNALAINPSLKVMIASGYYDLACPMATVEYELSQIPGGRPIQSRIKQTRYNGGHMMYINPEALKDLKTNIAEFINQQITQRNGAAAPALGAR